MAGRESAEEKLRKLAKDAQEAVSEAENQEES